jgi:beta-fructofuranosidase
MQYYTPGGELFLGDCMPFSDGETFHLYYLLDEQHHQGRGGLGGHQWAHASSQNLVSWQHYPLALPITDEWEASICTGSVVLHDGTYHAFYATRALDRTQHLGHAVSADGITFQKTAPNPFLSAPAGYVPTDFRDPFVFAGDDGLWHMLVTSRIADFPLAGRGGCLLHLQSDDLWQWTVVGPLLVPGGEAGYHCIPECPDYFEWNGWHYLLFGQRLQTHYRMARSLQGPWLRPGVDTLDTAFCAVMKTAPFGANRRIGVGWAGPRRDGRNDGAMLWGGSAVFRELIQHADGTLGTHVPPEMLPPCGPVVALAATALTPGCVIEPGRIQLDAPGSQEVVALASLPENCRIQCRVLPTPGSARFGLGLRGSGRYEAAIELAFFGSSGAVMLAQERCEGAKSFDQPFSLDVVLNGDIIDVCIDGRRSLINRLPERYGDQLFLFCEYGQVVFEDLVVQPLLTQRDRGHQA